VVTESDSGGAWRPLVYPVYRRLWFAQIGSNLGTWMQTVGAQWLIVTVSGSALLVGLVQTASTLPMVLLAAPAGVLADILDRRRLLVWVQLSMVLAGAALAALTFLGGAHRPLSSGSPSCSAAGPRSSGRLGRPSSPNSCPGRRSRRPARSPR